MASPQTDGDEVTAALAARRRGEPLRGEGDTDVTELLSMQITEVFETASPRPADAGGAGAGIGEGNDSIVEAAASVEPARTASDPAQAAGAMGGRRRRNNMNASTAPTEMEVQSGEYATREDMLTHEQGLELGRISLLLSTGCTAYDILNVAQHTYLTRTSASASSGCRGSCTRTTAGAMPARLRSSRR